MNIAEFRKEFPQYSDIPDEDLSKKLHEKYYSDLPYEGFRAKFLNIESPSLIGSVGLGARQGAADFYNLVANVPALYRKAEEAWPFQPTLEIGRRLEEPLRGLAESTAPTPEEMAGREGVAHGVAMGVGGLPSAVATYLPATVAAGPIGGFAAVEALRESDKGLLETAKGAAKGAAMGMGLRLTRGLPTRLTRSVGTGGLFGGMTAAEGGDVSDVATSSLLGAVLGLPGGQEPLPKGFGIPPEYLKQPTPKGEPKIGKQKEIWPRWKPTEAEKAAVKSEPAKVEPQWKAPEEQLKIKFSRTKAEPKVKPSEPVVPQINKALSKKGVAISRDVPQLIGSTVDSGTIRLQFDNAYKVPTPEEIKSFAKSKGYDVDVLKFQQDIISGTQGATNYKLDVFRPDGSITHKGAQELSKEFGGTFRTKTIAEQSLPLKDRFGRVHTKMGENLGVKQPTTAIKEPKIPAKPTAPPAAEAEKVKARLYRVYTPDNSLAYFTSAKVAEEFPNSKGIAMVDMKKPLIVGSVTDISKVDLADWKTAGYEAVKDSNGRVIVFSDKHLGYVGQWQAGGPAPIDTSELSKLIVEVDRIEQPRTPPKVKPTHTVSKEVVLKQPGMQGTYDKIIAKRGPKVARDWLDRQIDNYQNNASLWDYLKSEKGGSELILRLGEAFEALYKFGVNMGPLIGTRGRKDLSYLQNLRRKYFLSPRHAAEVEPYPDRFVDWLKKQGMTRQEMETIAKTGGKVSWATQADLKRAAIKEGYYDPKKGGSFINSLKKDMLSAYYGEGEPVYSAKKGSVRGIFLGGLDYKLEEKRLEEGLKKIYHKSYENLDASQQKVLLDLLTNFTEKGEIPEWVLKTYPAEVEAFRVIREHIFNPLYRSAKAVDPDIKPYLEAYFPRVYKEFMSLEPVAKARMIRGFAREHGISESMAERILSKGVLKRPYFKHLKESRKPSVPPGLEQILDLDTVGDMYISGTARFIGLNKWLPEARSHLANLPLESNIRGAMGEYIKTLTGERLAFDAPLPEWAHKAARYEGVRQVIIKLGFNLAGALVNYSQWFINSGTQSLAEAYREGSFEPLSKFGEATARAWTSKGQKFASRSGIFTDVGKGELRIKDIHGVLRKVATISNYIFDASERINKTGEWWRVYEKHLQSGKAKGLTGRSLLDYAQKESLWDISGTQFFMGLGDRPVGLTGPITSTMARFKVFTLKQLEFISNLRGVEKFAFLGTIMMLDGPQGLGLDILQGELEEHFPNSELVKDLGQVQKALQKGSLSGLFGVELTGKIGIGFFPGLDQSGRVLSSLLRGEELGGLSTIGGVTVNDIVNVLSDLSEGRLQMSTEQITKAALEGELSQEDAQSLIHAINTGRGSLILPVGVKRVLKGEEIALTGKIRGRMGETQKKEAGWSDIAKTVIGFQGEELVQRKQAREDYNTDVDKANFDKRVLAAEWQDARARGDEHKLELLRERLRELNREWYSKGIPPLGEGLIERLKGKELEMELRGVPPIGRRRLLKEKRLREER